MINLMKKDLKLIFSRKITYVLLILIVPIFLLINGEENVNKILFNSIAFLGYCLPLILFEYESNTKLEVLLQSLPITRSDTVKSKYIFAFISYTLGVVYILLYLWIINKLNVINVDNLDFLLISKSVIGSFIVLSLVLPIHFTPYLKFATIINMIFLVMRITSNVVSTSSIYMSITEQSLLIMYIISIAIYLVSAKVSIGIYENKELA